MSGQVTVGDKVVVNDKCSLSDHHRDKHGVVSRIVDAEAIWVKIDNYELPLFIWEVDILPDVE